MGDLAETPTMAGGIGPVEEAHGGVAGVAQTAGDNAALSSIDYELLRELDREFGGQRGM
jgi:hypothetical protein